MKYSIENARALFMEAKRLIPPLEQQANFKSPRFQDPLNRALDVLDDGLKTLHRESASDKSDKIEKETLRKEMETFRAWVVGQLEE